MFVEVDLMRICQDMVYLQASSHLKERAMSLTNSWYTIDEAASKFGLSTEHLQEWVDNGLVRTEGNNGRVILLNSDDIERQLKMSPSV